MEQALRVAADQCQRGAQLVAHRAQRSLRATPRGPVQRSCRAGSRSRAHWSGASRRPPSPHSCRQLEPESPPAPRTTKSRIRRWTSHREGPRRVDNRPSGCPPAASQPRTSPQVFPTAASAVGAEQSLAGRVESGHQAFAVNLHDQVGRAIHDGAQLLPLVLERLPQARPPGTPRPARAAPATRPAGHRRRASCPAHGQTVAAACGEPSLRTTTRPPGRDAGRPARRRDPRRSGGRRIPHPAHRPPPCRRLDHRLGESIRPRRRPRRRGGVAPARRSPASSVRVPPEAMSWLSWYCANSASASRWASTNAHRRSCSRAAMRWSSARRLDLQTGGPLSHRRSPRSSRTHDTRTRVEVARRTARQAAGPARVGRPAAGSPRMPR